MPAALDITGERYGRLVAVSPAGTTGGSSGRPWRFMCDCGSSVVTPLSYVRSGKASSCGCLRREVTAKRNGADLTGQKFGRLTVLGRDGVNGVGQVVWACACECGATTTAGTTAMRSGGKASCGCIRREMTSALGKASKKDNPVSRTPGYRQALKKRRLSRPEPAMQARVSRLLRWALADVGAIKTSATFDMLGYSPADLVAHLERQFVRGMDWDNKSEWQIDHIVPVSAARSAEDVIALNQLPNLRPMWATENNAKKDKRTHLL